MLLRTQFQKQIYDYIYSLANHINYCCSWLHVTLYFCTKYVNLIRLNFAEYIFLPDNNGILFMQIKDLYLCIYCGHKFYICLLLFKNCIFGFDGLFRGPLIDREICTDWRQFFWLFRHIFSLHNNNVIVRKRSINRWCYMVWCPLPFQYVWTTKESVLWMTCIKRYSKCNFNLPTNTAL